MKKLLLLGAAVFALQAVPAFAEAGKEGGPKDGKPRHEKMFERHDTNKDGVITQEESIESAKQKFAEIDANKDGKITQDESKSHHDAMKKKWDEKRAERKANKEAGDVPPAAPAGE